MSMTTSPRQGNDLSSTDELIDRDINTIKVMISNKFEGVSLRSSRIHWNTSQRIFTEYLLGIV
jgi:hypothetical protein